MNQPRGFTLLEVLIAVFIFALVSVMVATGLKIVMETQQQTDSHAKRLGEIQMAMMILDRDIEQVIDRPITDRSGEIQPPLLGDQSNLEFTHAGLVNPLAGERRSTLQRVSYQFKNHQWVRHIWGVLDQAPDSLPHPYPVPPLEGEGTLQKDGKRYVSPLTRILLTQVDAIHLRFIDEKLSSYDKWPPPNQAANQLPRAIEITFDFSDRGRLTRLLMITGKNLANH